MMKSRIYINKYFVNNKNDIAMTNRAHYKEMIAFANGFNIEFKNNDGEWEEISSPTFIPNREYRVHNPFQHIVDAFNEGKRVEYKYKDKWMEWDRIISPILPDATDSVWNPDIYDWRVVEEHEYKVGDWVKLVSERPYTWVSKMDKYLGKVVKIFGISGDKIRFIGSDGWTFWLENIERLATKEEILNSPYYDGSLTNKDFEIEVGDYVIVRSAISPTVFKIAYVDNIFYKDEEDLFKDYVGLSKKDVVHYATKKEIEDYKKKGEKEYVPFEWEDREQLRDRWVIDTHKDHYEFRITLIRQDITGMYIQGISPEELLNRFTFIDGSVCGKLKNN